MNNVLLPTVLLMLLTACGQKGNLYLPEQPPAPNSETTEPNTAVELLKKSEDIQAAEQQSTDEQPMIK